MKEITIKAENRVGLLDKIARLLGKYGINIETISAYGVGDEAYIRLITTDTNTAKKHLERIEGLDVKENDIIVLKIPNRPGELAKITTQLSNKGINLESLYIGNKENNWTQVIIKPENGFIEKTKEILGIKD